MKAITARKAAAHITPLMDAMWHRGIVTAEDCIFDSFEKFAADIASNNEVRIRSGVGMLQGRFFCIEPGTYDSAAISNGTQGEKRIDLIVARWTVNASSETEDVEIKVIQGTPTTDTPVAPDYTEGDLDNGELVADLPLYEVNVNGINIESLSAQFETGWLFRNGTLPASKGGTGKTTHTSNAVLTGNGTNAVKNVATANGALYATSANGVPKFGTLPIAQGGTGKTSAAAALAALGGISIKKLWTNASPSSSFAAQSISLDISEFDYIMMICNYAKSYPKRMMPPGLCLATAGFQAACTSPDALRTVEIVSNSSVKVGNPSNGNADELVPCYIFGIKGVS